MASPAIIHLSFATSVRLYEKYQIHFGVANVASTLNPYDPEEIGVTAVFRGPEGRVTRVNAFWAKDYCANSAAPDPNTHNSNDNCLSSDPYFVDDPNYYIEIATSTPWHVRFSPNLVGPWAFDFEIRVSGAVYVVSGGNFIVRDGPSKGGITSSGRNFVYERDRSVFFPIGINAVWNAVAYYNRIVLQRLINAIDQVAANKGNYLRIFITDGSLGIESFAGGLNHYGDNQRRALDLDIVLNHAENKGVYIQLCLESFDYFNPQRTLATGEVCDTTCLMKRWFGSYDNNPYKLLSPGDNLNFFRQATMKAIYKKKLRYILARWGYSVNVFSIEFFNEIDKVANFVWGDPVIFKAWLTDVVTYCKTTLESRHLFSVSVATADSGNKGHFFSLSQTDFYTEHYYTSSKNQGHHINHLANRARTLTGNKPYIIGEFGWAFTNNCYIWPNSFIPTSSPDRKYFDLITFHDALWASVLSGCSGTATYWNNSIFCYGQLRYFLPLVKFLEGEDLNLSSCRAIANRCAASEGDDAYPSTSSLSPGERVSGAALGITIETSDDSKVEVFALHYTSDRIIGWVKNKLNWWYNLPMDPGNCGIHNPHLGVEVLTNIEVRISGLRCDAQFHIDFYSTYPKYAVSIASDGSSGLVDGGIIPQFSTTVFSRCGVVKFIVPKLKALEIQTGIYAPDYGFKIKKIRDLWGHSYVGTNPNNTIVQPFAIDGGGGQIALRGHDGRLKCYYRSPGGRTSSFWHITDLAGTGPQRVQLGGAIFRGRTSGQIYYHGIDDRLQCTYWDGSAWQHTWLTDWSNATQNVDGDIVSNSGGGRIFYRGTDGKLHYYYWGGSGWVHSVIYLSALSLIAEGSNIATNATGTIVVYKNTFGMLHIVYESGGAWLPNFFPGDYVDGFIRMNDVGNVIFYRGRYGKLHQCYYDGSIWITRLIITMTGFVDMIDAPFDITHDCTPTDAQVYLHASNNHVFVVYGTSGSAVWTQDSLMCGSLLVDSGKCRLQGYIRCTDGMVAYEAASGYIEAYYFDFCENEHP